LHKDSVIRIIAGVSKPVPENEGAIEAADRACMEAG
jgi:hypothetical protein